LKGGDRVPTDPISTTRPGRTATPSAGPRVTAFGGWQLGGDWGAVDDTESVKILHHAYERGINFVDTAELYGCGTARR
jgi:aryl-alcohol dehydrogenase-like predicted oxidoreductase